MSVQNLRNKFNQNIDGPASLSCPGTYYGSGKLKSPNTNPLNGIATVPSKTGSTVTAPSASTLNNGNSTVTLQKPSSFLYGNSCAQLKSTQRRHVAVSRTNSSPSSTKTDHFQNAYNGTGGNATVSEPFGQCATPAASLPSTNGGTSRAVQNIANRWGSVSVKKPPEQSREEIIRNRWSSKNSAINNNDDNNNNNNFNNNDSSNNNSNSGDNVGDDVSGCKSKSSKYLTHVLGNSLNNDGAAGPNDSGFSAGKSSGFSSFDSKPASGELNCSNSINRLSDTGTINKSTTNNNSGSANRPGNPKATYRYAVFLNNSMVPSTTNGGNADGLSDYAGGAASAIAAGSSTDGNRFNSGNLRIANSAATDETGYSGSLENGDSKWRQKPEDVESRAGEESAYSQKILKDYNDLQTKYNLLLNEQNDTKRLLLERNEQLMQLRSLSEGMCKEYDQLKIKYDLESSTMQKAMERALQWYKQNRELKRRSSLLMQHVMAVVPDKIPEMMDDMSDGCTEEQDSEIAELRKTIQELNGQISRLKVEINCTSSNEQQSEINTALQKERTARLNIENQYRELEMKYNRLCRSSRTEETDKYETVLGTGDTRLDERLKLMESEMNLAMQRAQIAEEQLYETTKKVTELEKQLNLKQQTSIPAPPPLPSGMPPPPPPPMPTLSSNGTIKMKSQKQLQNHANHNEDDSATEEMANLLGIPRRTGLPQVEGDTIDKIINELKGGRFTLKSTEKQNTVKKEEEEPPVVHEMRNILGTLRRQPARRESFKRNKSFDGSNS